MKDTTPMQRKKLASIIILACSVTSASSSRYPLTHDA